MKWINIKDKKPSHKEETEIIASWFTGFVQSYDRVYKTENIVRFLQWNEKFGWVDACNTSHAEDFDCYREIKPIRKKK